MAKLTLRNSAAAALALCVAQAAQGSVLFDNFGPGDMSDRYTWWGNGDVFGFGETGHTAMSLDLGPGIYDSIAVTLPLTWSMAPDPSQFWYQVKVYADDGTSADPDQYPGLNAPGTCLATIDAVASDLPERWASPDPPIPTVFTFDNLSLTGDTRYWVAIETDIYPLGGIEWYCDYQGLSAITKANKLWPHGSGEPFPDDWLIVLGPNPAMRVEGSLIPEPASLALLLGCGLASRRRRD